MRYKLFLDNLSGKFGFKNPNELWLKILALFKSNLNENAIKIKDHSERNLRVLLSGASSMVVKTVGLLTNLLIIPLAINSLGSEKYGIIITIFSFYAFIWFTDLGLGNSLLYRIVNLKSDDYKKDLNTSISSTFYSLVSIALFVAFSSFFFFPYINFAKLYNISDPLLIKESMNATIVLLFIILVNIPLGIVLRIQEGFQAGFVFQFWSLMGTLLSAFLTIIFIRNNMNMPAILFALISGSLLSNILAALFVLRKKTIISFPQIKLIKLSVCKTILKDGMFFFATQTFTILFILADNLIITQVYGPTNVTDFDVVRKMFYAAFFTQYFISPLMPAFGNAINSGDVYAAKKMYLKVIKISIVISLVFGLPLFLFGRNIISVWIGIDHIPTWGLLLSFYVNTLLMNYIGICTAFLNSGKLLRLQLPMLFATCLIGICLKIMLCKFYGLAGIMWGNVLGYALCFAAPGFIIINKFFNSHQREVSPA